ncbi:MAG: HD-GYP domain-containing protein [Bacteriovoracaceae bacterium]
MSETNFAPICLDNLKADCPFNFDLYIRINEKYILYVRNAEGIEEERLDKLKQILKLKEKEVDRIFIKHEEQEKFNEYIGASLDKALDDTKMPAEEQANAVLEIVQNTVEVIFNNPESVQAYALTEKVAKGLRKLVQGNPAVLKQVFTKKGRATETIENHCKNTATLALKIAFSLGFRGEDLDNLGAAALLHDVGHVNINKNEQELLFRRPLVKFSPDDKRIYIPHVTHSVQMVSNKPFVNEKIIKLIAKHEERLGGNGYPNKEMKLELLEQVLGFANNFDKRITIQGQQIQVAYKDIQLEEMGNYDLRLFQKLRELLLADDLFQEKDKEKKN